MKRRKRWIELRYWHHDREEWELVRLRVGDTMEISATLRGAGPLGTHETRMTMRVERTK